MMKKTELVVSLSKTEYIKPVIQAGADAVCIRYRSFCTEHGNRFLKILNEQLKYVHSLSKKLYFGFDFFAHNEDIAALRKLLPEFKSQLEQLPDAIVVYDPGVFCLVKEMLPDAVIHVGAEINVTNSDTFDIWHALGAARVELAHVLHADGVEKLASRCNTMTEVAAFVYGVPCISYSGRTLLSGFLQECHIDREDTSYYVMEEQRQGEYYMVNQDNRGSYIYDAKVRNWLPDIDRLVRAGVNAFCIEGMTYDEQALIKAVLQWRAALYPKQTES